MLWDSVRTIWIHGTIEISVIIVAACAGLVVGKSILFPGTYTRLASFVAGVKAGLKIVVSTIPFFIIAGFLEGFVTRHTEMPDWLAIFIILISIFQSILFYYVFYPIYLNKKVPNVPNLKLQKQRELGDIISDTFKFIRQNFKPLGKFIFNITGPVFVILLVSIGFYSYLGMDSLMTISLVSPMNWIQRPTWSPYLSCMRCPAGILRTALCHRAALH